MTVTPQFMVGFYLSAGATTMGSSNADIRIMASNDNKFDLSS